jgi:hypothetical protein
VKALKSIKIDNISYFKIIESTFFEFDLTEEEQKEQEDLVDKQLLD